MSIKNVEVYWWSLQRRRRSRGF